MITKNSIILTISSISFLYVFPWHLQSLPKQSVMMHSDPAVPILEVSLKDEETPPPALSVIPETHGH